VTDRSAIDAYLGTVRGRRIAVGDAVPAGAFAQADSLIEHGEPAEGVLYIAWVLHKSQVAVRRWMNEAIVDLAADLVHPSLLPPRLPEEAD